ncbi:TonB-dependent receptor [Aestuariivita sp.]|jgi:hemoglobin/transferrin/lactoferrin receptor protein|uniref:TonB-dependent receptor domain-containing protein n=1 Tax=Aestuariivita sp. TaxID=1872407 RepID=UPI0021726DD4|nr:TonB-dependent receptor [Aestuariivita sp.]MCE8006148.1 TonB-dependent receptor plug domain-containing protein [Aestuariivita sp.]
MRVRQPWAALRGGVAIGAICAVINPATAQEAEDGFLGTIALGESKREVQTDTATPVTVVDQEEIEDRQAGTVAELIDSVPGVTLVNGDTPQGSGINLRGFGSNETFGTDQKVLIQIDGATRGSEEIYRIGNQLFTDPYLYREVEVIRGTVGSYEFGSGVIGGVVRLETINASDVTGGEPGFAFRQNLEFTSNGEGITSSSTFAYQLDDYLELLVNYTRRTLDVRDDGDGNPINPLGSEVDNPSYLVKARYRFGTNMDQSLTFSLTDTQADEFDVPYETFGSLDFGNVDRQTRDRVISLRYNYNPVDNPLIDLDVELVYADQEIDQVPVGPPGFSFGLRDADHQYETTTFRVRNRAMFVTGAVDHDLRTGIEFIRRERADASSAPGGTDDRVAIFAVNDMRFGNWTITPGLRYETSDIEGSTAPNDGSFSNNALMGGLSVRYAFDNGIAVFASAAYTENLPIIDDLNNTLLMTQSEKSRTFELGASFDGFDVFAAGDRLSLKGTLYDSALWDATSYRSLPPGNSVTDVDRQGFELEASYAMENGVYIDSYLDVSRGDATREASGVEDWEQNPANSLGLTVGRRFNEAIDLSWEVVANQRYDRGPDVSAGYAVHNLRATFRPQTGVWDGTEIRVGLENVFDKQFTRRLSTRPSAGRNLKVSLAKTF